MSTRPMKLQDTLKYLVLQSPHPRKKICADIGITPSALSQYLHGDALPSLSVLIAFAEYFHVSLDYLIFHTPEESVAPEVHHGAMAQYINSTLANIQTINLRHTQVVHQIGQKILEAINEKALEIAQEASTARDVWPDNDLSLLEKYSRESKILTLDFEYDMIMPTDADGMALAGSFFAVVVENLRKKQSYQFLLSGTAQYWKPIIMTFREMLSLSVPRNHLRYCDFRCTISPVGCGFYHLDVPALRREQPMLYERVRNGIDDEGWVGYVKSPARELRADLKMDISSLSQNRAAFAQLWEKGERLR